jgi:hypothetical protein
LIHINNNNIKILHSNSHHSIWIWLHQSAHIKCYCSNNSNKC